MGDLGLWGEKGHWNSFGQGFQVQFKVRKLEPLSHLSPRFESYRGGVTVWKPFSIPTATLFSVSCYIKQTNDGQRWAPEAAICSHLSPQLFTTLATYVPSTKSTQLILNVDVVTLVL